MSVENFLLLAFNVLENDCATGRIDEFSITDDGAEGFGSIDSDDSEWDNSLER